MAITATQRTDIVKVVVGLFNAAPGAIYLNNFTAYAGNTAGLTNDLIADPAFTSIYPSFLTSLEFGTKFIDALVGNAAAAADKQWAAKWIAGQLDAGSSRAEVVTLAVTELQGAAGSAKWGAAATQFVNKVAVAEYYSVNMLGSATDVGLLQSVVGSVTATTDVSTPAAREAAVSATPAGTTGQTFMLTKGLDNVPGTSGNDTIIGSYTGVANDELNTVSTLDVVNGGAGTDTLKISSSAAFTTALMPNISNVEVVEIAGKAGVTVNTTSVAGVTNLNVTEHGSAKADVTAAATTDIAVTLKEDGAAASVLANLANGGKNVTVTMTNAGVATASKSTLADTISVGATTAAAGDVVVNVTGAAYTAATANSAFGDITIVGGKTISVTQKAASSVEAAASRKVANTTITQGDVTVDGDAQTTTVTIKQDATVTQVPATDKTGGVTASTSVKFGALKTGDVLTVAGLTFTAAADMTANEVAATFANLINGAAYGAELTSAGDTQSGGKVASGVYTGIATGWTSGAASADTVVFTSTTANSAQTLTITDTGVTAGTKPVPTVIAGGKANDAGASGGVMGVVAGKVDIEDKNATIKTITVDGYGAGSSTTTTSVLETLNLSNSAVDFTVADTAATLALNLEKIGTSTTDAVLDFTAAPTTLNIKSTGNNYVDLDATTTTTLNVSGTGVLKLDERAADELKTLAKITVTETAGLTLGALNTNAITSVDTTGTTGAVSVTIDGTAATYAGGAGKDTVALSKTAAISKAIDLGAGDDTLVLGAGTTAVPTVEVKGGEGVDTISMTTASANSFGGATTFAGKLSGFERLTISDSAATNSVNVENLGFNYVTTSGSAGTLTLNNMANNSTVVLTANGTVAANIKNASDVANTSDVLNVVARVANDVTHGTLTAAGVETINLTTEDTTPVNTTTGVATINKSTLTLAADKATTINLGTSNAHLDLTLTSATNKVTLIDGANMTGNLNVQAVGATSTTIKGGSGNDVLKASAAVVTTVNATGTSAVITDDAVADANARAEVQRLTITADGADDNDETLTVTFGTNGVGGTGSVSVDLSSAGVDVTSASAVANAVVSALNSNGSFSAVASAAIMAGAGNENVVEISYFATNVDYTEVTAAVGGTGTYTTLAGAGSTPTVPAAAVAQQTTVVLTDGSVNTGLSAGDTMKLTVGGTEFTYTAAGTETTAVAGAGLAALINANASYTAGFAGSTITITAATAGTAGSFTTTGYAVTDAMDVAAAADKLFGGNGNDVLVANALLTEMTGGAGNDLFVINTASINVNSYSTIMDFQAGDLIEITGISAFKSGAVALGGTEVFQDKANAAVAALGLNEAGWFQHDGNTYIVADMGTNGTTTFVNGEDFIVKLTGLVDLSNASFNNTHDTIALV